MRYFILCFLVLSLSTSKGQIYNEISGNLLVLGNIDACGDITANSLTCDSDIRFKRKVKPLSNTLDKINQLRGVQYYWDQKKWPDRFFNDKKQVGFIAQELEKVYPEMVRTNDKGFKSVDYSRMSAILVEALKEQQEMIVELQEQNVRLTTEMKRLNVLDRKLTRIEAKLKK